MNKHPKIRYHYDFPNLPIHDNDVQALYEKMEDILWTAESHILEFSQHEMQLPDIFVSDDVVTETYGKYDYKAILKEARNFYEAFPYSYFNDILERLVHAIKQVQEGASCKILKELIDLMEAKLDHAELPDERAAIEKIISMLKNTKRTTKILGAYYHYNNRIVLYINSIARYFDNAPTGDFAAKIKTGLEIVLAHEVFHAVQYHLLGTDYADGKKFWTYPASYNEKRNSVLEGLARWFEYCWCCDNQFNSPIYQWHKEQIDDELYTYYYPGWPYAAAKVFVQNGKPLHKEPMMVLNALLESVSRQSKHCWRNAYDVLEILNHRNKRLNQNF